MLKIAEIGCRVASHQNRATLTGDLAAGIDARARVQLGIFVTVVNRTVHRCAGSRAEERLETARLMRSDGLSMEMVVRYTGLSEEEINNL